MIVEDNGKIILSTDDNYRNIVIKYAELIESTAEIEIYKLTIRSLTSAIESKCDLSEFIEFISGFPNSEIILDTIISFKSRYCKTILQNTADNKLLLTIRPELLKLINNIQILKYIYKRRSITEFIILPENYANIKLAFLNIDYPIEDKTTAPISNKINIYLYNNLIDLSEFELRDYQLEACLRFIEKNGTGIINLPCGSGKTVVGIYCLAKIKRATLIVCPSVNSINQWKSDLIKFTSLKADDIGVYTASSKEIKSVTITTYQMLISRASKNDKFATLEFFQQQQFEFIIFDEVHRLPSNIFRLINSIKAKHKLGLTGTMIREDSKEKEILSLIGNTLFIKPWKELERSGYIAKVECIRIFVSLSESSKMDYDKSKTKFQVASVNPNKADVIKFILSNHSGKKTIIIGHYVEQLQAIQKQLNVRLITGNTPTEVREQLYNDFRNNKIDLLLLSRIGNEAINLPQAEILVQVSGLFGSRQEEAQRLGRILRRKTDKSYFYSIVTKDTVEVNFSNKRQRFLNEQGYIYKNLEFNLEKGVVENVNQ